MDNVLVSGSFDNLRSRDLRFLEEASRFGPVHVALWSDEVVKTLIGVRPIFPEQERKYLLEAIRFVHRVQIVDQLNGLDELPRTEDFNVAMWVVSDKEDTPEKRKYCASSGLNYQSIKESSLSEFPVSLINDLPSPGRKVVVTGCFDWFHSGHVRFFEETSQLGDLYVVIGHDANVRLLKGDGHPMFPEDERRYMVNAIRYVKQAIISTGTGWMDAEPEIDAIQPDLYVVNEDGDKPEKREFCRERGLNYLVLKRTPAEGLPRRESTHLRGF